jgi:hypothetical protein
MQLLSFQDRQGANESRLEMQPGQQCHRKPVELVIYNILERNWSTQKHPYGRYISADYGDRSRVRVYKFSPSSTPNVHELWSIIMYCYMSWSLVEHYIQIRIVLFFNHNFDILVNDRLKKLVWPDHVLPDLCINSDVWRKLADVWEHKRRTRSTGTTKHNITCIWSFFVINP